MPLTTNSDELAQRWVALAEEKHQVCVELTVSPARHLEIEFLTRQQTETLLWYEVRSRHITGSNSGKILCQVTRTDALLKSILYPSPILHKPPPIKWGIQNEKLARNVYIQHMRETGHSNLVMSDCGFIVSLRKGWLGASQMDKFMILLQIVPMVCLRSNVHIQREHKLHKKLVKIHHSIVP